MVLTATLGFPRMGPNRELKFGLEKFWRNKISSDECLKIARRVEEENWEIQAKNGVSQIGVGSFTLYDHVLDWTTYLGCEPERFDNLNAGLETYFAMARGVDGIPALDMTKWFDTNYHYEVPELSDYTKPTANFNRYLETLSRAKNILGSTKACPIVLGPITYLKLAKLKNTTFEILLDAVLPLYEKLMETIYDMGFESVQIHEPYLVHSELTQVLPVLSKVYGAAGVSGHLQNTPLQLNVVTYFDEVDAQVYEWFLASSVKGLSLDFTRGDNLKLLEKYSFPENRVLGVGIVDGRSVWKVQPQMVSNVLQKIKSYVPNSTTICLQPSCSLQHLPHSLNSEVCFKSQQAETGLYGVLSFASEKLIELTAVKTFFANDMRSDDVWTSHEKYWHEYYAKNPKVAEIWEKMDGITATDLNRREPFQTRRPQQLLNLPILPTTTIGSFPQTGPIRALRKQFKSGSISQEDYETQIDQQIAYNIGIQEGLGLDLLVHGEPERTDMVEYFAEKLDGFAFSQHGWVQSYGSRCVRPPIIYGDLQRPHSMTVREFKVAQRLTVKPVKGMLTGPVTILNWSFPRKDISRQQQAFQLALCLRKEVVDLESAGAKVIQMDEPALREGMPLRANKKQAYLAWAVDAFKLSTAVARSDTSIHTHMCYAEFHDCMDAIQNLDADINSIENARSNNETILEFKRIQYQSDLGPGVYDIHSPVIPTENQIKHKISSFLELLPASQLIINPGTYTKSNLLY